MKDKGVPGFPSDSGLSHRLEYVCGTRVWKAFPCATRGEPFLQLGYCRLELASGENRGEALSIRDRMVCVYRGLLTWCGSISRRDQNSPLVSRRQGHLVSMKSPRYGVTTVRGG
jgi:hypothetical protein